VLILAAVTAPDTCHYPQKKEYYERPNCGLKFKNQDALHCDLIMQIETGAGG